MAIEKPNSVSRLEEEKQWQDGHHLVLFPSPFQGHINPMMQLATLLHSRGFTITIIHTQFNSPDPSNYPHFNFQAIPDGLSDAQTATEDLAELISAINTNCEAPLHHLLAEMFQLILVFRESSCEPIMPLSFVTIASISLFYEKGYLAGQGILQSKRTNVSHRPAPDSEANLTGLPVRIKDLPAISTSKPDAVCELITATVNAAKASSAIIWNTSECLEHSTLAKVRQDYPIPVFPIAPLHRYSSGSSGSSSLKAPNSVVYVSFGSIATIDKAEAIETAMGLANSEQPFLWVVRPGSVRGVEWVELPEGFEEKTRGRGLVVKWAPQLEVLAHPSIGGFWTHCGWNSTLESICEGVPMLCWSCFGDQLVNARLVTEFLKVGVEMERELERGEIERGIRRLMVGKESEEVRERIKRLKEDVEGCMKKGGSSHKSLESLIDLLLSF
ncbi:UDP-glycosyltransferase 76C2-like protein [Cinnamomum micranthum f. kanehirae]|uniref:UDP-glycosyltransferase 76C2-like protein n=1 Tax=Cinnamomum micranthum f. kanehirae TaxID=337451 RepID=A0A3S3MGC7_9MAGN|nr:UDP-glycosyltransferase 76C2-like protein [Cinnamomum micranthum f. kanehirae]